MGRASSSLWNGLGYSLLVFVYEKTDDDSGRTGKLNILHTIFVDAPRTADFQTTRGQKPVVVDDTCYFLPCKTREEAGLLAKLLNSPTARSFFHAFIFWDAKRPITAQLLAMLDFGVLGKEVGVELIPARLRSGRGQMKFL